MAVVFHDSIFGSQEGFYILVCCKEFCMYKLTWDPEGIEPKTDSTDVIYTPFYLKMHNLNFIENPIQLHVSK